MLGAGHTLGDASLLFEKIEDDAIQKQTDRLQAIAAAKAKHKQLSETTPYELAYAVADTGKPANARIHVRGDPTRLGEEVPRRFVQVLGGQPLPKDCGNSGRLELANWIADPANPLTARVLVNHVWTRHFGQPLVANLTDFGRRATKPIHAELLDWLAVDFMEHGWSLKHLHRQMVLSEAYRMTSSSAYALRVTSSDPEMRKSVTRNQTDPSQSDPENKFYWRMNPQRMDANVLRDSLLHLAGTLDLTLGGPTIDPKREDSMRRSFYFTQSPEDLNKFLEMFDNANTKEC